MPVSFYPLALLLPLAVNMNARLSFSSFYLGFPEVYSTSSGTKQNQTFRSHCTKRIGRPVLRPQHTSRGMEEELGIFLPFSDLRALTRQSDIVPVLSTVTTPPHSDLTHQQCSVQAEHCCHSELVPVSEAPGNWKGKETRARGLARYTPRHLTHTHTNEWCCSGAGQTHTETLLQMKSAVCGLFSGPVTQKVWFSWSQWCLRLGFPEGHRKSFTPGRGILPALRSAGDCERASLLLRQQELQQVLAGQKGGPSPATLHTLLKKPWRLCTEHAPAG